MNNKNLTQVSNIELKFIEDASMKNMPNNPSERGMTPDRIKKAMYEPFIKVDNDYISLLSLIKRIINEQNTFNDDFVNAFNNISTTLGTIGDIPAYDIQSVYNAIEILSQMTTEPTPNTVVKRDSNGNIILNKTISLNGITFNGTENKSVNYDIDLVIDNETYIITLTLKQNDVIISTKSIDLPLEQLIVSGSFDSSNKKLILSLKNGNVIEIPVSAMLDGLVNNTLTIAGIALNNNITANQLKTALGIDNIENNITGNVNVATLYGNNKNNLYNGIVEIKSIKGKTIVHNNLLGCTNFGGGSQLSNITASSCIFTATSTTSNESISNGISLKLYKDHKYAMMFDFKSNAKNEGWGVRTYFSYYTESNIKYAQYTNIGEWQNVWFTWDCPANASTISLFIYPFDFQHNIGDTAQIKNYQYIDLTLMFGKGKEPTTYDEYISLRGGDFSLITANSLVNSSGNIYSTSKNIWDEKWEQGYYDDSTGTPVSATTCFRSKNYIPVKEYTQYYIKQGGKVFFYNELFTLLGVISADNEVFTTPSKTRYIKFYCYAQYGNIYNNNNIIAQSSTTVDYQKHYEDKLSIIELKQAGNVYDEISNGKLIRRINTYTYNSTQVSGPTTYTNLLYFSMPKPNDSRTKGGFSTYGLTSSKFTPMSNIYGWDDARNIGGMFQSAQQDAYWIGFPVGTTLQQAANEINGLIINYEVNTPVLIDYYINSYFNAFIGGNISTPYEIMFEYANGVNASIDKIIKYSLNKSTNNNANEYISLNRSDNINEKLNLINGEHYLLDMSIKTSRGIKTLVLHYLCGEGIQFSSGDSNGTYYITISQYGSIDFTYDNNVSEDRTYIWWVAKIL